MICSISFENSIIRNYYKYNNEKTTTIIFFRYLSSKKHIHIYYNNE